MNVKYWTPYLSGRKERDIDIPKAMPWARLDWAFSPENRDKAI